MSLTAPNQENEKWEQVKKRDEEKKKTLRRMYLKKDDLVVLH